MVFPMHTKLFVLTIFPKFWRAQLSNSLKKLSHEMNTKPTTKQEAILLHLLNVR